MSHDDPSPLDESVDPALARELERLPAPAASAEFRERMRKAFVAGELEPAANAPAQRDDATAPRADVAGLGAELPAARAASSEPHRGAPQPPRRRFALAAAAIVIVGLGAAIVWQMRYAPQWLALRAVAFQIDGRELLLDDEEGFELNEGSRVESGASSVLLRLDDRAVLELAPGTTLDLIALPTRGAVETIEIFLTAGSLRVATTAGFAPTRMQVSTPDATARVIGTAFGVDVFPGEATCVCCTLGRVDVEPTGAPGQVIAVEAGGSAWCPTGGEPATLRPGNLTHFAPIELLRRYE